MKVSGLVEVCVDRALAAAAVAVDAGRWSSVTRGVDQHHEALSLIRLCSNLFQNAGSGMTVNTIDRVSRNSTRNVFESRRRRSLTLDGWIFGRLSVASPYLAGVCDSISQSLEIRGWRRLLLVLSWYWTGCGGNKLGAANSRQQRSPGS